MVTSAELGELVAAIARSSWFKGNRNAICKKSTLARILEAPRGIIWRLSSSETTLRPLPKEVADTPGRIEELFPDIHSWAKARRTVLCVEESASLTAEPIRWAADDLDTLFSTLSPRAFQSGALAPLLADFLAAVEPEEANRIAVGPHLASALRKAMAETASLASSEHLTAILSNAPRGLLFPLPVSVEHRQVLRALAVAPTSVLPVRAAWLGDTPHCPQLSNADLRLLLEVLEPHIGSANADQAATAALAFLTHAEQDISELACHPDYASIKVLRARDLRAGGVAPQSIQGPIRRVPGGTSIRVVPRGKQVIAGCGGRIAGYDTLNCREQDCRVHSRNRWPRAFASCCWQSFNLRAYQQCVPLRAGRGPLQVA